MRGSSLHSSQLQDLLGASYDKKQHQVGDFSQDRSLSTKTSKVYTNPSGQVVVAHRGTSGIADWGNNLAYAVGGNKLYKTTSRFKEAQAVQREAAAKYGNQNVTTIGHSQGGLQAELLGKNSHEIITLNKASRPYTNRPHANQTDIQTQGDLVSAFSNPTDFIQADLNPLAAHSIDTLSGVATVYGQGLCIDGDNTLTDVQIDKMLSGLASFHGCFVKDQLPKLEVGFYCVNLNGHSHWCGLQISHKGIAWFDAFGFPAPVEVERLIGKHYKWNDIDIQDIDSSACGYYVAAWIKWLASGQSFDTFIKQFSHDTARNEKILQNLMKFKEI